MSSTMFKCYFERLQSALENATSVLEEAKEYEKSNSPWYPDHLYNNNRQYYEKISRLNDQLGHQYKLLLLVMRNLIMAK